jgi:hypothetical protein
MFSDLKEHYCCQIKAARRPRKPSEENGAVSEDCAAPHENPNLTLVIETGNTGFRSKGNEKRFGGMRAPGSHKYSTISMTSAAGQASIELQIHDNEWQTARGDGP